jgi:uncharacterized protein DUF1439
MRGIVALALLMLPACTVTRTVTRDQLQARLAERFPVEKRRAVLVARLSNPMLAFVGERLSVALDIEATAAVWTTVGHAVLEGSIEYRPDDGGIYVRDPVVRALELDKVPVEFREQMRLACEQLLAAYFVDHPLYALDAAHGGIEAKARQHLRRVYIANDALTLVLR